MNSKERSILRARAHNLNPVVIIGKNGINQGAIKNIDMALKAQELIKVKFIEHKDDKKSLSEIICDKTKAEIVGNIGHTIMLFRQNPNQEKQKYKI